MFPMPLTDGQLSEALKAGAAAVATVRTAAERMSHRRRLAVISLNRLGDATKLVLPLLVYIFFFLFMK
jgi:hypothetical protein